MSNSQTVGGGPLVIKQQRDRKADMEPTGEAESLWGRIDPKEMGTRFKPLRAPLGGSASSKRRDAPRHMREDFRKPQQAIHEALLALVRDLVGDSPGLAATAHELADLLSREDAPDRKTLEDLLGLAISPDVFSQLLALVSKLPKVSSKRRAAEEEAVPVLFEASSSESEKDGDDADDDDDAEDALLPEEKDPNVVDIDLLAFAEGGHLMTNRRCILPEGSVRTQRQGFEEVQIPAPIAQPMADEQLMAVADLPDFFQAAFAGRTHLNRVQTQVAPKAVDTDDNLLVSAPTGAGKTNIALLALLRCLHMHGPAKKTIYVAPMKALVTELVGTLSRVLNGAPYGVQVAELTGDSALTRAQLAEPFVVVCTPEKLDILTRKITDPLNDWFLSSIKLVVLDEVHLLHDLRGPVLESLIARFNHRSGVRLLGLSATLPNYEDVAECLRVPADCTFHFDASYRPCPLALQLCAVSEQRPIQRMRLMDRIVLEKIAERTSQSILVFVHSRREAARTARQLADQLGDGPGFSRRHLADQVGGVQSADVRELLPRGIGIHHAGLSRSDRALVESLFAQGRFPVLVSTATLAWGVNLPARTVIIKGTDVYSPDKGRWVQLSPQDTLQMLGRAGRPQFDSKGEGIIVTVGLELEFYLSLSNQQLPIESQLVARLIDCLNAEVVNGCVMDIASAHDWLARTYLAVRIRRDPVLYGNQRGNLVAKLIHSAFSVLDGNGLAVYDARTERVEPTALGRIASHFYLTWRTVGRYAGSLRPTTTDIDLLRVFCLADEFRHLVVRTEERVEMARLLERVPIPVRESADDALAKINVLLQCYISRVSVEGLALLSDLTFVAASAARLFRALHAIALARKWAPCARLALDLCKCVERRQWRVESPLRQFAVDNAADWLRRLERRDFCFERLFDLDDADLSALIKQPAHALSALLRAFPRVQVQVRAKPRRHDLLQVTVSLESLGSVDVDQQHQDQGQYHDNHINASKTNLQWHVWIEDVNRTTILGHRLVRVAPGRSSTSTFALGLMPSAPVLFVAVAADRFLGTERVQPVNLARLVVPPPEDAPTPLIDVRPLAAHKLLPLQVADKAQLLSVALTQTLPSLHREFVYSAGSDYAVAGEICRAPGYATPNLRLFDTFDYRTEVSMLKVLLSNEQQRQNTRLGLLLPQASNVRQLADWMQVPVAINYQPDLLPVESDVLDRLADFVLSFACSDHVHGKRDILVLLSRTFLYRRLLTNPSYYGCPVGKDLSEFLSGLVEQAVEQLAEGGLVEHDVAQDYLAITPLGQIAAKYGDQDVTSATIEMFALSMTANASLRNILDLLSAADEFSAVVDYDPHDMARLYANVSLRIPSVRFHDAHHQTHIALQAFMAGAMELDARVLQLARRLALALKDVAQLLAFAKAIESCDELLSKLLD